MYGRKYRIAATVTVAASSPADGVDLLEINSSSGFVTVVHEIAVTQASETDSEQLPVKVHRGSTSGSSGSSVTPRKCNPGDSAFSGTVESGNTVKSTEGEILNLGGFNVLNPGWFDQPKEEGVIIIPPSGRLNLTLDSAPTDSITFKVFALVEEI
jgi:hypothetical protein